ncbi:uncharacterized protein [Antedon mediterranea]|uniref:uncharacterized protein n=1 Tax=Antedon mediterranea TaxID=105859 RepID=UPI003AF7A32F
MLMDQVFGIPCSLCVYVGRTQFELCSHIVKTHRNDPNFIVHCSVENCAYSTKNWATFRKHVNRQHPNTNIPSDEHLLHYDNDDDEPMLLENQDAHNLSDLEKQKYSTAVYLLKLETEHKLSQRALNDVVTGTSMCLSQTMSTYRFKIEKELEQQGIVDIGFVQHLSNDDDIFQGFETTYLRHTFFSQYCKYVAPEKVLFGMKEKRIKGHMRQVEQYGYIVPFKSSIKALLDMPEVQHFVRNPHFSNSEMLLDVCDGLRFKNSPLFQRNPSALQIIVSHDDLELMNPLGAHIKKHKMSMFYYTIANIPPQHRSRLSFIQLLGVAKTSKIREFGAKFLLHDFITCLNEMRNGGMRLSLNGVDIVIEGDIMMCPCDTLAAQYLAGFKEGA